MRRFVGFCFLLISGMTLHAQESINWLQWEEAMKTSEKPTGKKYIVDLYTDWCGWCKKMDLTTFRNPIITQIIDNYYVPIKFNAEGREDIRYNDKVYSFTKGGRRGYHRLAAELTKGRLSYPTLVFMDENANVIQAIPGYQDACTLEKIMTYFSGDYHKTTTWVRYENEYQCGEPDILVKMEKGKNHATLVGQKNK